MKTRLTCASASGPALFLGLLFCLHLGCLAQSPVDKYVKIFFPNGKTVNAELAVTDEERAKGLMFREKILPDQGMLFVFETESLHAFWMKNTLIPLDMLWLDSERRVIHIEANVPPCKEDPCPSYGPQKPARYVLELKAGAAAANGIKIYDRLQFVLPGRLLKLVR